MLISFIIPVYNGEKYIERCLTSVCSIPNDNFQIIVIDDGSSDHTREIINKLSKKYFQKIKLISKKNEGVSKARNIGIQYAEGKYIAFIDADDEINTDNYLKLISLLDYDYDCVMFGYNIVSLKCRSVFPPAKEGKYGINVIKDFQNRLLDFNVSNNTPSTYLGGKVYQYLVKRELLIKNNVFFPENIVYAEDLCFVLEMFRNINTIYVTPILAYKYYINLGSAMHSYNIHFWDNWKNVIEYLNNKYLKEYDLSKLIVSSGLGSINHFMEYYTILNTLKTYFEIKNVLEDQKLKNSIEKLKDINWTKTEKLLNYFILKKKTFLVIIFFLIRRLIKKGNYIINRGKK